MDWDAADADWKQIAERLKARFRRLTVVDLEGVDGRRERLLGRLREAYGLTGDLAESQLRDWERHQEPVGVIEPGKPIRPAAA